MLRAIGRLFVLTFSGELVTAVEYDKEPVKIVEAITSIINVR